MFRRLKEIFLRSRSKTSSRRAAPQSFRPGVEMLETRELLTAAFVPHQLIIQFNPGVSEATQAELLGRIAAVAQERLDTVALGTAGRGALELVSLAPGRSVTNAIRVLQNNPAVAFAGPNWILTNQATSTDLHYTNGNLWGMYGDDPTISPSTAPNQYGSQAEEVWAAGYTGSRSVYVGIIDEGIDYRHPDLYRNIFINQAEIPSAVRSQLQDIDGDNLITFYDLNYTVNQGTGKITDLNKNGYIDGGDLLYTRSQGGWADGVDGPDSNALIDDICGWDFNSNDRTTYDGKFDDHGTHVAGTIGASANGQGVVGVNWDVTMIPVKFLGNNGGTLANAIKAIDYITGLKNDGLNVVATNNSWGGGSYSQALLDAIVRAAKADILFIAAAGNGDFFGRPIDSDKTPQYPSSYNTTAGAGYDAVIAVAAIDSAGNKASWSNYGATTVDLGAPGVGIYSTLPDGKYGSYSGTSMATPHVTGAVALYASTHPGASAAEIKQAILNSTISTPLLVGKTLTGGRLNIGGFTGTLSISDPTPQAEGNTGDTTTMTFTVTLSAPSRETVTVQYMTGDGSASANSDYTSIALTTLTFTPGQTVQTFTVSILGDVVLESNETFFVLLTNPLNASILDGAGLGTIVNDDF